MTGNQARSTFGTAVMIAIIVWIVALGLLVLAPLEINRGLRRSWQMACARVLSGADTPIADHRAGASEGGSSTSPGIAEDQGPQVGPLFPQVGSDGLSGESPDAPGGSDGPRRGSGPPTGSPGPETPGPAAPSDPVAPDAAPQARPAGTDSPGGIDPARPDTAPESRPRTAPDGTTGAPVRPDERPVPRERNTPGH